MYPQLISTKVDPRVIEAVWEIVERMPPAAVFGRHSQTTGDKSEEQSSVIPAKDFKLSMLSEDDFLGRVSWYFEELQTPVPSNPPLTAIQVTETGIAVVNNLVIWGKTRLILSDLLSPGEKLVSYSNDPTKFDDLVVANEASLVGRALSLLNQRL